MTDGGDDLSDYVRRVHENTQKYLRDLIAENDRLFALIHTLERELDRERKDRLHIEERIAAIDAERRAYLEKKSAPCPAEFPAPTMHTSWPR